MEREIHEIEGLYLLDNLAEEYANQNGSVPFNVSHWDPSEQTVNSFLKHLKFPPLPLGMAYIYSYPEAKQQVLHRLGFTSDARRCGFVHTGTTAVLLGAWWLKAQGVERVLILCPTYFPIFHVCEVMNLPFVQLHMRRLGGQWHLPIDEIGQALEGDRKPTALWITNPTFCTGCYLQGNELAALTSMLESGVPVVADECLSLHGYELGATLGQFEQFLGLYSPHKAISINATKFAALSFDARYEDFFDGWTDVLAGPLASSSYSAIRHFLDENFVQFQQTFSKYLDTVRIAVRAILENYKDVVETDEESRGHFMTCYAPRITADIGNNEDFLKQFIWSTGALVIPGVRYHFVSDVGFSFRINLARACPQFYSALHRIGNYVGTL